MKSIRVRKKSKKELRGSDTMEVEFSLDELKGKLWQDYVSIEILVDRYYNDCELKFYAKPIKPLDLIVPPTYLGNIIASEVGNQRYKAPLDKIDKILTKKGIVEEMNARCRRLIEKLKALAYSDERSVGTMP